MSKQITFDLFYEEILDHYGHYPFVKKHNDEFTYLLKEAFDAGFTAGKKETLAEVDDKLKELK